MNKFLKRIFSFAVVACLASGLSACGGTPDNGSDPSSAATGNAITISFWNPITGPDAAYMQTLVADFNKEYKGQIYVNADAQAEASHYQRITTSFTDQSTADLCLVHKSRISSFQRAGKLRPMTSMLEGIGVSADDYVGDSWTACEINGEMYAAPYDVLPTLLFYNRKLIPAGYTEADILSENFTIDKMLEMMQAAYQHAPMTTRRVYGMAFNYSYTEPMFLSFLNQQGAAAVDAANPTVPTFANEKGYAAAEAVKRIPFTLKDGNKVCSESGSDHLNVFTQGRALFTIDGIWSAPSACEKTEKVDAGVALLPKMNADAERNVAADGHVFVTFDNKKVSAEKDQAIATFMNYLIEHSEYWCQGGKVAARADSVNNEEYQALEWGYLSGLLENIISPVKTYTYDTITNPIGVEVAKLCEGIETDVQKAVNKAAQDAKQEAEALQ